MLDRNQFAVRVQKAMEKEVENCAVTIPAALHLVDDNSRLDDDYYLRHTIETVKRIRLTSRIYAQALASMTVEDYEAARRWARYTAQEMNHDLLFLAELQQHGYSEVEVSAIPLFPATRALVGYLSDRVATTGATAAVAYSLFVEWSSSRAVGHIVRRSAVRYCAKHIAGARAHLRVDEEHDHYAMMLDVAWRLTSCRGRDPKMLLEIIRDINRMISDYFRELHAETFGLRSRQQVTRKIASASSSGTSS